MSNDFKNHVMSIIDAFKAMDRALVKEQEDMAKRLAERQSHVWKAKQAVISFWGRVSGIADSGLDQQMKQLNEPSQQLES